MWWRLGDHAKGITTSSPSGDPGADEEVQAERESATARSRNDSVVVSNEHHNAGSLIRSLPDNSENLMLTATQPDHADYHIQEWY
jgi:hypothetical protein